MENIDLEINKKYIFLGVFIILAISLIIGYSYISSDLNLNGTVATKAYTCNQTNLYEKISCMSTADNVASKYISNTHGVDFTQISSDTNGKGVYTLSSTLGDTYPIHYYRGAVDNNNVKFANFCWKIVRTTDTGGTKLIYNGNVDSDGHCSNIPDEGTEITANEFNTSQDSLVDVGYMFKEQYRTGKYDYIENNTYLYGNSFTYDGTTSTYTLVDTTIDTTKLSNHHYTCKNTTGTCSSVYYLYNETIGTTINTYYYILLSNGKSIEDALNEMHQNDTDSNIKEIMDNWYQANLNSFSTKIEDTIWCNDRTTESLNGWSPNNTILSNNAWYSFGSANFHTGKINLTCPNQRDNFTKSAEKGNGLLECPIGLLTKDEIVLAGGSDLQNTTFYLNNNRKWWTMTPKRFTNGYADLFYIDSNGQITQEKVVQSFGIRPSISLNNSQVIASGTGTSNDPYVIS